VAAHYPTAFEGYKLEVVESHQATKADTSGTARAVAESFRKMGFPFEDEQIRKVRDPLSQVEMFGVPPADLGGHAYHTYSLDSPDRSVHFSFTHNVRGRQIYADGTIDAVEFLASKIAAGESAVYNMFDVLERKK
jgi:4-hydroxy-tetrahydrodipicolinate reductase